MHPQDYPKFQTIMANLSVTYGKELSQPLTDVYWEALKPLYIEQLQNAMVICIRTHKHFPRPADLYALVKETVATAPRPRLDLPPPDRKWLALINGMFLKYLSQRRLADGFQGNLQILSRRAGCLELVNYFEALEAEGDPEATERRMKNLFDNAMARIPDVMAAAA